MIIVNEMIGTCTHRIIVNEMIGTCTHSNVRVGKAIHTTEPNAAQVQHEEWSAVGWHTKATLIFLLTPHTDPLLNQKVCSLCWFVNFIHRWQALFTISDAVLLLNCLFNYLLP